MTCWSQAYALNHLHPKDSFLLTTSCSRYDQQSMEALLQAVKHVNIGDRYLRTGKTEHRRISSSQSSFRQHVASLWSPGAGEFRLALWDRASCDA